MIAFCETVVIFWREPIDFVELSSFWAEADSNTEPRPIPTPIPTIPISYVILNHLWGGPDSQADSQTDSQADSQTD